MPIADPSARQLSAASPVVVVGEGHADQEPEQEPEELGVAESQKIREALRALRGG